MKQQQTIFEQLTSRYLLIIRDEDTFAEKVTIRFNYARIIFFGALLFLLMLTLSFFTMTTVLSKWFDPRTSYRKDERKLVELQEQIDSLVRKTQAQTRYTQDIKNILLGKVPETAQAQAAGAGEKKNAAGIVDLDFGENSSVDSLFRKEFEELDYEKLAKRNSTDEALEAVFFFSPVKGIVSRKFDLKKKHYGTDVVAARNEPIKCIAQGTVIMSAWTQEAGYVIAVQHKNQLISFYKHNSVLFKKVGDAVKAGDPLAIIGNSGDLTDGPHLHFELWYDGHLVDPEEFIVF